MRKIRFAIIGCGRIAPKHAESIQQIGGADLVAVCDIIEEKAQSFAKKYQADFYIDYLKVLERNDIDVVNICTSSGLHAEIGIAAAKAGKHVIVEKPMSMHLKEADELIKACKESGVKLAVCHQNRFNKSIKQLRQALEQGRFGRLTHGNATIRWNRNDDYYKQATWRGTWKDDGGVLMNQSIHNIDLLQWMLGPVESIFAYTARNLRKIEAEDVAVAVLKFSNGALGNIEASSTIYPKNLEETLNIFGETGTACIGGMAVNKIESWRFKEDFEEEEKEIIAVQEVDPPNVYGFGHQELILDMIGAIRENREPMINGQEGRKALEIILGIYKSVATGQPVRLPLEKEFILTEVFGNE